MDETGLSVTEHLRGNMPLLHDKLMRDIEFIEDEVEDFNIIA